MNVPELHEVSNPMVQTSAVSVFYHVSLATMAEAQAEDSILGLAIQYMHKGVIPKIKCKPVQKYLLQFD